MTKGLLYETVLHNEEGCHMKQVQDDEAGCHMKPTCMTKRATIRNKFRTTRGLPSSSKFSMLVFRGLLPSLQITFLSLLSISGRISVHFLKIKNRKPNTVFKYSLQNTFKNSNEIKIFEIIITRTSISQNIILF